MRHTRRGKYYVAHATSRSRPTRSILARGHGPRRLPSASALVTRAASSPLTVAGAAPALPIGAPASSRRQPNIIIFACRRNGKVRRRPAARWCLARISHHGRHFRGRPGRQGARPMDPRRSSPGCARRLYPGKRLGRRENSGRPATCSDFGTEEAARRPDCGAGVSRGHIRSCRRRGY